jgi:AhpC/TSA family
MSATVLWDDRVIVADEAVEDGEHLWLSAADLEAATGWVLKPVGLCQDDACVPLPRDGSWSDGAGRVDLAAFAARFNRPIVRDQDHSIWAFGSRASGQQSDTDSIDAPDFTLPDVDGELHSLSDYRGKKVLILSWGSY